MIKKTSSIIFISGLFLSAHLLAATTLTPKILTPSTPTMVQMPNNHHTADPLHKVNINKADIAELQNLPRVGAKLAQRIVDYRQQHGAFKSIDDLKQVKGISDKMLIKMKDQIVLA